MAINLRAYASRCRSKRSPHQSRDCKRRPGTLASKTKKSEVVIYLRFWFDPLALSPSSRAAENTLKRYQEPSSMPMTTGKEHPGIGVDELLTAVWLVALRSARTDDQIRSVPVYKGGSRKDRFVSGIVAVAGRCSKTSLRDLENKRRVGQVLRDVTRTAHQLSFVQKSVHPALTLEESFFASSDCGFRHVPRRSAFVCCDRFALR